MKRGADMKQFLGLIVLLMATSTPLFSKLPKETGMPKSNPEVPQEILLWPDGAPGALGNGPGDKPSVTPYLAKKGSGAALVICPGGGYGGLAGHEGGTYALFLNQFGVTCF